MKKVQVLFVCVENAGRSQMAEFFFRKYAPANFQASSAGTKPASEINPIVKQVMNEKGFEFDNRKPKMVTEKIIEESDISINMGCMDSESCPRLFLESVKDWQIEDTKGKSIEEVRKICNIIETNVQNLVLEIQKE